MNITKHQESRAHCNFTVRMIAVISIMLALGGCGTGCPPGGCVTTVPINVENNSFVFLPALRMGVNLDDVPQASEPHTGQAIEVGIAQVRGRGNQYIAGNEQVALNNNSIVGPQILTNEFGLYFTDLSYRWRKFPWERTLGFELSGGLGYTKLDLAASSATQRISGSFSSSGLHGGLGLIWRLNPGASLQARATVFGATTDIMSNPPGVNSMQRYELSVAKTLGENLTMRAGYAAWTIKGYGVTSDFNLHSAGPTLMIDWDFNGRNFRDKELSQTEPLDQIHSSVLSSPVDNKSDSGGQEQSIPELPDHTPSPAAFAAEKGFYTLVGAGQVRYANSPVQSDPSGNTFRIGGGYNFNSYAGVEIGYSTGKVTATYNGGIYNSTNTLEYSAVHVATVASYPYTDKFGVFAKLGLANTTLAHTFSSTYGTGSGSGKKTNIMFGLGWKLKISQHFGVHVQYENLGKTPLIVNYGSSPYDVLVQVFSVGCAYNF